MSSLAAISGTLQVLELEEVRLADPEPLYFLEFVRHLALRDNFIDDINKVASFLRTMNDLTSIDLRNNPITRIGKYRD